MLAYALDAWATTEAAAVGGRPVVVFSPTVAAIIDAFADRAVFALQDVPRGTGDALAAALAVVPATASEILVLSGDVPLVTGADLDTILEARREDDAAIALASVYAADPAELGRVVRGEFGTVERIAEARDATPDELAGNEINAGLYAFDAAWLRRRIDALTPSAATGELYLTDLIRLAREDGRLVSAVAFEDDGRFAGINDRSQLAAAEWTLRVRLNEAHMRAGVTMRDPSTAYLDWTVELGEDVILEPNVILRGTTTVGAGSVIGAGSQLIDATIGAGVRDLGQHRRVVDGRGRGDDRAVQPSPAGDRRRPRRRGRQLRRAQEHAPRRGIAPAPHELPRRRARSARTSTSARAPSPPTTTGRANTRRRSAPERSSASIPCSSPRSRWARAPGPAPARSSPATSRRASWPSVSRPASASRVRDRPRRRPTPPLRRRRALHTNPRPPTTSRPARWTPSSRSWSSSS